MKYKMIWMLKALALEARMNLKQIVQKEDLEMEKSQQVAMVYSPKLGKYVPIDATGENNKIQKYNVGLGPGSWY